MRKLTHFGGVGKGDVLCVSMSMTDKKTGKPYVWRFFGVTTRIGSLTAKVRVIGKDTAANISTMADEIHFLEPDEWPDGVHMFRTQMILKGDIDLD